MLVFSGKKMGKVCTGKTNYLFNLFSTKRQNEIEHNNKTSKTLKTASMIYDDSWLSCW